MANASRHTLGAINLRGVIVPILDLRIKFALSQAGYDDFTVLMVLNPGYRVLGMVVDSVSDVIGLAPDQRRPVPEFSSAIQSEHVMAIGSLEDRMLILLDVEKLICSSGMGLAVQTLH